MFDELDGCHALLLQGPVGPFFRRFADELRAHGARVTKVNLNAGDDFFYRGADAISYRGRFAGWRGWLGQLLRERGVDVVFLFGDQRPYHRVAREVTQDLEVPLYAFEEGYLRPDYITLEPGGVNGCSPMSRDAEAYRRWQPIEPPQVAHIGPSFRYLAWYSMLYSISVGLGASRYGAYEHHKDIHTWREAYRWGRGGVRKVLWRLRDRGQLARLTGELSDRFFLMPLQVHNDFQLQHAEFDSVEAFIRHVVASFAAHAPQDSALVLKHHPLDRPYTDYTELVAGLSREHGLGGRLVYVADLHLPTLLRHARGTVLMNSTVGLSSLHHGTPVKALGHAIYDVEGLAHQGPLDEFWREPGRVDKGLYQRFRNWLEHHNQANGSFYRRLPGRRKYTGVRWFTGAPIACRTRAPARAGDAAVRQRVLSA